MKGVIAICLSECVAKRFGAEKWKQVLEAAGLPKNTTFLPQQSIDDSTVLHLYRTACSTLGVAPSAAAELFGEHWCCNYAPRIYSPYYVGAKNAKDFLLRMKEVHEKVTRTIPDARPPVFTYEQPAPNKLIMRYSSHRGLADLWFGLVKGVGRHFKENLQIQRIGANAVAITFPS